MTRQMVMLEVDVPLGYEATGEYRAANVGEIYIGAHEPVVRQTNAMGVWPRIILREKVWQPPRCFPEGAELVQSDTCDEWRLVKNCTWFNARVYAAFHGEKFTPPEGVTKIQVQRGTP